MSERRSRRRGGEDRRRDQRLREFFDFLYRNIFVPEFKRADRQKGGEWISNEPRLTVAPQPVNHLDAELRVTIINMAHALAARESDILQLRNFADKLVGIDFEGRQVTEDDVANAFRQVG